MGKYNRKNKKYKTKPICKKLGTNRYNHTSYYKGKANNTHGRHVRLDFLEHGIFTPKIVAQKANRYWSNCYIQNI